MKIQNVFNLSKERFIDVSMFKHFNFEKQFKLKTNTFNHDFFRHFNVNKCENKTVTFDDFFISKNEKFKKKLYH